MPTLPATFWPVAAIVLGLVAAGAILNLFSHRRRQGSDSARASLWPRFHVWLVAAVLLLAAAGSGPIGWALFLVLLAVPAGRELSAAFRAAGGPAPLASAYVALPLALLAALRGQAQGFELVVWTVLVVILTDIAAMFGGMYFGRRPLAPAISPAKTWEGCAVGLLGGLAGAALIQFAVRPADPVFYYLATLAIGIADILGDLAASWIKRRAGIKDFSAALPGHGGVMDRIDGLLFAAPVAWLAAPLVAAPQIVG